SELGIWRRHGRTTGERQGMDLGRLSLSAHRQLHIDNTGSRYDHRWPAVHRQPPGRRRSLYWRSRPSVHQVDRCERKGQRVLQFGERRILSVPLREQGLRSSLCVFSESTVDGNDVPTAWTVKLVQVRTYFHPEPELVYGCKVCVHPEQVQPGSI